MIHIFKINIIYLKGNSQNICNADRKANNHGHDNSFKSTEPYNQICVIIRPNKLS